MKNIIGSYELVLLSEEHFKGLYNWYIEEKNYKQYTCRPIEQVVEYDVYIDNLKKAINSPKEETYVLVEKDNEKKLLGKIRIFDYNSRNHSAEFGYYLPDDNRKKRLGSILLRHFLNMAFEDTKYNLNKLYATTASNNIPSIKLLEKFEFKLDGKLREHYWIDGNRYDQLIYSILKSEWIRS